MNDFNFRGADLRTATIYDIATKNQPAILISPDKVLTDEFRRILGLYTYSVYYDLTDLQETLQSIYKEELRFILS